MATTPMDFAAPPLKDSQSIGHGLPTPSSLPVRAGGQFPRDPDSDEVEPGHTTPSELREDREDPSADGELFDLEREGEITGTSGAASASQTSESEVEPVPFFSNATLIRRPYRARYQAMDEDSTTPPQSTVHPLDVDIVPSFKRSFERTQSPPEPPPVDDDAASVASIRSVAPPSRFRHSFDSQRATLSTGPDSASSSRNSTQARVVRQDSERNKRRRPSQTRQADQASTNDLSALPSPPADSRHRFTLPTRLSLPSLSRRPVSPTATLPELSYRRATSFSHRLAPPAVFGINAQASSTAYSTLTPIADSGSVLRPRPARVSPEPSYHRQREEENRRRRDTLDRADELLDAAEDTLRRTRPLLGLPGVPRDEPRVEAAERGFPSFPSIRHLPNPERPNDTPPIIGVRLGEGWNRRTPASDPILHIPRSLFDPPTPNRTPPPANDPTNDVQPAHRSFRSLNLSTLRNRRNQASPVAPPEWNESVEIAEAERLNEMLARRRTLQHGLERPGTRNESNRAPVAESSTTMAESRRTGGDVRDGRESMLWGEVRQLPTNPRLRGPTERANEQWRLHSFANAPSPLPDDMRAPSHSHRHLPRPTREGIQSFQQQMEYEDGPSIWRGARSTPPATSTTPPPRASHDPSGETETSPFAQRATSPSPSRRRFASERQRADPPVASTSPARRDPVSLFSEESAVDRRLRFRRRAGVVGGEEEEDTTEARTWRPPPRPLRLPNALPGRGIVFPHPAAVAGPVNSQAGPEARRTDAATSSDSAPEGGNSLRRARSIAPPRRSIFDDDFDSMRAAQQQRMAARIDDSESLPSASDVAEASRARLRRQRAEMQDLLRSHEADSSTNSFLARSRIASMNPFHRRSRAEAVEGEPMADLFGASFFADFRSLRNSVAFDSRNYLDDDEFDSSYEALVQLSERLGDVPKSSAKINTDKLKKFAYRDWPCSRERPTAAASTSAIPLDSVLAVRGVDKDERCAICLADYEDENEVMMGDCFHAFHKDCLESWLTRNSSCPICRVSHS